MGIIKMAIDTVSGTLSDSVLEAIEADDMGERTVFCKGVPIRAKDGRKGTDDTISNGSVIHVYPNQFMMLVDGGKVVDYTAEPGYYNVNTSSMPSLFNGEFKDTLKDAFNRFRYGGTSQLKQKAYFINLQEIKGIKFGTSSPLNYFDNFYNAELFVRVHGVYSVKITNPILFYAEAIPKNADHVEYEDIALQYNSEFLEALQSSIGQMSMDNIRISNLNAKTRELSKYMRDTLDSEWNEQRGFEVQSVAINAPAYDDESKALIQMRNKGAMVGGDPNVLRGLTMTNITEGIRDAGSNPNGAMAGFMGVGMGMQQMGNITGGLNQMLDGMQQAQPAPQQQPAPQPAPAQNGWTCGCGTTNTGKFCANCGQPAPAKKPEWTCECGAVNTGKFCANCGKPAPQGEWTCECGTVNTGKFCGNCGKARS